MRELLVGLVPWGVDAIVAIQAASGNALDPLFRAITWLGDAYIYLPLLSLALWRGDKPRGMRLALLLLFSMYLNLLIKDVFAIPRPFVVSSAVLAKDFATGYSFPSGHAQGVTTLWLGLAVIYARRGALAVGGILIPLVSFSRVYLGVHYPQDAVGGILLGLAVVGAYRLLEPPLSHWWYRQPTVVGVALCVLGPLALAVLTPDPNAHAVAGAILGLSLGRTIEVGWSDGWPAQGGLALVLRILMGAVVAGAAYVVASLAVAVACRGGIAAPALIALGQSTLVGLAITLGVPWLFGQLGRRDQARP